MGIVITNDNVTPRGQRRQSGAVSLEAGPKCEGIVFVDKLCKLIFKPNMKVQCSIEQSRAATASTIKADSAPGSLLDSRVVRQIQIVIGSEHQDTPVTQSRFSGATIPAFAKDFEVDIETGRFGIFRPHECAANLSAVVLTLIKEAS
jgi:hypothetical protein